MTVRSLIAALAICLPAASSGQIIFFDDFEGGTSAANYTTVVDTTPAAGTSGNPASDIFDAAFSYTDLGASDDVRSGTGGLLITENALTAFINGLSVDGSERISIRYDLYANPSSSGSTEYSFVGVGAGALPFQHFLRGSEIGNEQTQGVFAGGLTDSDTLADGDYVILEGDGSNPGSPIDLFNADAALEAQDGTSFEDILPARTPGPSGESTPARVLQHRWVAVEFIVDGDTASYFLDGQEVATVTASGPILGQIGLGIGDPFPSTNQGMRVPPTPDTDLIIDNVTVEILLSTSLLGDADGDGDVDGDDLIAVQTNFGSVTPPPGDADGDGDVDGDDLIAVQTNFGATSPSTAVPEPSTVGMFVAIALLGAVRRRVG